MGVGGDGMMDTSLHRDMGYSVHSKDLGGCVEKCAHVPLPRLYSGYARLPQTRGVGRFVVSLGVGHREMPSACLTCPESSVSNLPETAQGSYPCHRSL